MSFTDAFRALNGLKRRKIIRDYVVIGAVAATNYMEPVFTEDIDIVVLVDTDEEYRSTFTAISQHAEAQDGMHQVLGACRYSYFRRPSCRYTAIRWQAHARCGSATLE